MGRVYFFIILFGIYLVLDLYVFTAVRSLTHEMSSPWRRSIAICYWGITILLMLGVFLYNQVDPKVYRTARMVVFTSFAIFFFAKIFAALFVLLDDLRRVMTIVFNLLPFSEPKYSTGRAAFMSRTALIAGAVPIAAMSFGIISGAHDYRVRRRTIYFKSLPKAFDGVRIAQVSDIHTGSFFNKTAVEGGVDLLLQEKPDIAFFTGDLVNNKSEEAKDYLDIFKRIKAPLGTYSVMGNHDYGDYTDWPSGKSKQKDIKNLHRMHAYMGYDLLLNQHRKIKADGEEIAILGCENWGSGRFAKYGDLAKTVKGTENQAFRILLSHDPSHWDAQVRPQQPDIDLTLSGHTHGMQLGVEIGDFRWSPVQYRYKQWADLYREGDQYLYVNRGYGYIGYPGRIGILPEVTILELRKS